LAGMASRASRGIDAHERRGGCLTRIRDNSSGDVVPSGRTPEAVLVRYPFRAGHVPRRTRPPVRGAATTPPLRGPLPLGFTGAGSARGMFRIHPDFHPVEALKRVLFLAHFWRKTAGATHPLRGVLFSTRSMKQASDRKLAEEIERI